MVFSFGLPFAALWKSQAHSYHPVPAPDEETLLASPTEKENRTTSSFKSVLLDPSSWLTAFAVLSVAVTARNILVIQMHSREPPAELLRAPVARPYHGLENLVRNESSPSWPLSFTHYPDFIGAKEGDVVRNALQNASVVQLDSEHTVILQHRVRDYGLEQCAVRLQFSPRRKKPQGRAYGSVGDAPHLKLWRLHDSDSDSAIKNVLALPALPTSLSAQKELLGEIVLNQTHPTQSPFFGCTAGSVQTLEIAVACSSDPCVVEFRLMRSPQPQGFWMVQSEQATTFD